MFIQTHKIFFQPRLLLQYITPCELVVTTIFINILHIKKWIIIYTRHIQQLESGRPRASASEAVDPEDPEQAPQRLWTQETQSERHTGCGPSRPRATATQALDPADQEQARHRLWSQQTMSKHGTGSRPSRPKASATQDQDPAIIYRFC